MSKKNKFRLFIAQNLQDAEEHLLNDSQSHYLANVLRLGAGDEFRAFDNRSGEYDCQILAASKKEVTFKVIQKIREFEPCQDIWLMFAPVKKDKTDFIIEKATELGARKIMPIITRRTISEKVKTERYAAQAIEAAEQCRRVDLPEICPAQSLENVLKNWKQERILYFMDETGDGEPIYKIFCTAEPNLPAAILIGPEGGFDADELKMLRAAPFAKGVSLGKRILRAETAVAAALSCWQALCGDWS